MASPLADSGVGIVRHETVGKRRHAIQATADGVRPGEAPTMGRNLPSLFPVKGAIMEVRRLCTTLAAALVLVAAGACSKEAGPGDTTKQSVGAKIDRALDTTQQKLEQAGEKAREGIAEATGKTQETLSKAGEKISTTTSNAIADVKQSVNARDATPGASPPYAPRQPVQDNTGAASPASNPADTTTTATSLSTGPTTTVKSAGIPKETRATLSDAAITASIKADLLKDPDLSVLKIDVDTRDGVVTLNGLAANESAKTRAERMAQAVKGVREVRNFLTVKRA